MERRLDLRIKETTIEHVKQHMIFCVAQPLTPGELG